MHLIIILLLVFLYLFFKIYNKGIYETLSKKEFICLVIVLVLSIGLRGPGVDNDYTTYVASIGNYLTISEPTFIFISANPSLPISCKDLYINNLFLIGVIGMFSIRL